MLIPLPSPLPPPRSGSRGAASELSTALGSVLPPQPGADPPEQPRARPAEQSCHTAQQRLGGIRLPHV